VIDLFLDLQLPAVLYVPHRNERWCKTGNATWWDLAESKKLREKTIADLIEDAATFDRAMVVLRPLMEGHRDKTVGEALGELPP
jgi:hypothetical protein